MVQDVVKSHADRVIRCSVRSVGKLQQVCQKVRDVLQVNQYHSLKGVHNHRGQGDSWSQTFRRDRDSPSGPGASLIFWKSWCPSRSQILSAGRGQVWGRLGLQVRLLWWKWWEERKLSSVQTWNRRRKTLTSSAGMISCSCWCLEVSPNCCGVVGRKRVCHFGSAVPLCCIGLLCQLVTWFVLLHRGSAEGWLRPAQPQMYGFGCQVCLTQRLQQNHSRDVTYFVLNKMCSWRWPVHPKKSNNQSAEHLSFALWNDFLPYFHHYFPIRAAEWGLHACGVLTHLCSYKLRLSCMFD